MMSDFCDIISSRCVHLVSLLGISAMNVQVCDIAGVTSQLHNHGYTITDYTVKDVIAR